MDVEEKMKDYINRDCKCLRPKCGHKWKAKGSGKPQNCPKCKSPKWYENPREKAKTAIPMACTKCKKEFNVGDEVYHLQEGTYDAGRFKPNGNHGMYCEDCAPPEDQCPFES